jgi:hypothetical protein
VEIRDALTARCLIATGEVKGIGPTPAELHLTQSLTATSLTNVHVAATGTKGSEGGSATRLAVDVERAGTACQFTGPIGDIAFRTVKESLTVDAANSVAITGDCTGQLQVQAGSLRLGSVQGCGTLSAEEIVVTEDVAGQDDGLIITAGSTLRVGGTARNAALLCDASGDQPVVTVGYASGHPTRLGDPELSPENVQPALPAPDRAASSLPDGQVDSCMVVVGGGVAISRSVSSSLLRVDGQLQVEGDLDCSAPAIANLLPKIPPEYRERLGTSLERQPCTAQRIIVVGDVRLAEQQVVRISSVLSAASVDGGEAELTDPVSTFVAGRVARTKVTAQRIGVRDAPEQTTLRATGLLHLAGGAPVGNTITFGGPGVFGAAVKCPLTWEPDGDHVCELRGTASTICVTSGDGSGDENEPLLRVAAGQPVEHLHLNGRFRVETSGPEAGKRTRGSTGRGQGEHVIVSKLVTLGDGARLHLGPGRLDLGEVDVTSDAKIHQDCGQNNQLTAGILPSARSTDSAERIAGKTVQVK